MADDLIQLETWAASLLVKIAPPARRKLATSIARALRGSQQERIAKQIAPDGTPYAARKSQGDRLRDKRGQIRRKQGAMFVKLRTARWLKANATAEGAEVGFVGRVARLARVHQEGLADRASLGGKMIRYPARPLLGFSERDRALIRDLLLEQLAT
jgi:phage virion morphogenesis protein